MDYMEKVVKDLSRAVQKEYAMAFVCQSYSILCEGELRPFYEPFFQEKAADAMKHAKLWGDKMLAIKEPQMEAPGFTFHLDFNFRPTANVRTLLRSILFMEEEAIAIYASAYEALQLAIQQRKDREKSKVLKPEESALLDMFESHLNAEQVDIDELQKMVRV